MFVSLTHTRLKPSFPASPIHVQFQSYMRECGMPEHLQSGGADSIRIKYHTECAAAYKAHLAAKARGEAGRTPLTRVPFEEAAPPAPRATCGASGCGSRGGICFRSLGFP